MNIPTRSLSCSLFALLCQLPCQADLFLNGDFASGQTSWEEVGGNGTFVFSYPDSGGNLDAFGVIDHTAADGGFGLWVGNDGQPFTLDSLGLAAENTYNFTVDMKILSGPNVGGFKLDFTNVSGDVVDSTDDLRVDPINGGSTWQTYNFRIPIPAGVDGFKVVPLWGVDSSVGFDNIGFDPTPVLPPVEPPKFEGDKEPQFTEGTLVNWIPTNSEKLYQPQSSQDEETWSNFGPAYPGTETTSVLDPNSAPFYRVQEKDPAGPDALLNGDFEIADPVNLDCPESWECTASAGQFSTRITTDSYSGDASVRLAVFNDDGGAPNSASLKHNFGTITAGETYTFSFWAKQISSGVSYVQNYKILWFSGPEGTGAQVGIAESPFTGGADWEENTETNLIAPAGAVSIVIEFTGATGAVLGVDAKGEVLVDSVSLSTGTASTPTDLEATTAPGAGVFMLTEAGKSYKAQVSNDLQNYTDLGGVFTGNGQPAGAGTAFDQAFRFYRFKLIDEEAN